MTTPPGWYHAQGDPEGTIRYWDGAEWSPAPTPAPPGWQDPHHPNNDRFAAATVRVFASIIDGLIAVVVVIPFMIDYLRDIVDDVDAGGDGSGVPIPGQLVVIGIAMSVVSLLMVAFLGGTPGKLMLGLRITHEDGASTPPGLGKALLRSIPGFLAALPVIGQVIAILVPIAALIMVINDQPERRSIYDRIAGTRVVRKASLPD